MRITRLNQRPNNNKIISKEKQPRRKIKRCIKESDIPSVTKFTEILNAPGKFSYIDYERNKGAIEMFRHQINQAIFNYGSDLQYFRRYNSFFQEDDKNAANYIYGEDTTAEFYASGMVRAFVQVENMAWNFNQIGLEGTEQVTIYLSIDNFEQAFEDKISKIDTRLIEADVYGSTLTNEVTGIIREPEFEASVYAQFSESDMKVHNTDITIIPKNVNPGFYKSIKYQENKSEISGSLKGKLKYDKEKPFIVSGTLKGELSFHGSKNLENAETWKRLAPQVGDYFKLEVESGISEEWEVTQIYDKNLTKSGLNPLLGKYVYLVSAARRIQSYENNTKEMDFKNPGEDIDSIFGNISNGSANIMADQYTVKKGKNVGNKKTNNLGKNIYDYDKKSDETYGGIQNKPKSK